jgi:general secretion pathway protein G
MDERRGGFSLVELLVAMSIIGILAGLALPNMRNVTFRARAAAIFGDVSVVRQAVLDYNAEQTAWPADVSSGTVPTGLQPLLPENFSFAGEGYELDYENITLPGGLPSDPSMTLIIGVAITVPDDALSNAVVEVLGGAIAYSIGNTHTVVISAS